MRHLIKPFILLLAMCASSFCYAQYSGDNWSKVKSAGSGSIAMAYVETPGFVYKDESGNLTGICVDIMKDFVKYVNSTKGVKLSAKFVGDGSSFRGMYNSVKGSQGGVFGLGNITITEARKSEVKFSPPFITNFAILISQNKVPTLPSLQAIGKTFAGMTAYTAKGTLNEKRLVELKNKYYPAMKIAYQPSSPATLEKVINDPKAFAYMDVAFYLDAINKRVPLKRHAVGDQGSEQFGIVMPLSSDWQPLLSEFFGANGGYANSIAYKKILAKHLGDTGVKLLQAANK